MQERYNFLLEFIISSPETSSLRLPCVGNSPAGTMVTLYSPLSLSVRFLSSKDPVDLNSIILPSYSGAVMFKESPEDIIDFSAPNLQATDVNGVSDGFRFVSNNTALSIHASIGPSGNTPAPSDKPT